MNAIFTRRSVRKFADKKIEAEKLEKILRAGMQAPSAYNQQAWEFIVVRGKENLEALSKYNEYASSLRFADAGIIVLGNNERFKMPEFWEQDLAAVTQNMLLEITELGLGGVWYGTAPKTKKMQFIQDMYELPENLLPFSVIGVGYPLEKDANKYIDRFEPGRVKYIGE